MVARVIDRPWRKRRWQWAWRRVVTLAGSGSAHSRQWAESRRSIGNAARIPSEKLSHWSRIGDPSNELRAACVRWGGDDLVVRVLRDPSDEFVPVEHLDPFQERIDDTDDLEPVDS